MALSGLLPLLLRPARLAGRPQRLRLRGMRRYAAVASPDNSVNQPDQVQDLVTPTDLHVLSEPDAFGVEEMVSVRELYEARVHLGHKTGLWNPLMKPYILGSRAGIHVFDLDVTLDHLKRALNVAGHIAYRNGIILFIGERSQFEYLVQKCARDSGEYFVTGKWRSGTLTNSHMLLRTMRLPDLVIFLSVPPSKTAIKEVAMAGIPSIGVVDSDCDPRPITYPVPGNDDTLSALRLYCRLFGNVISRAKERRREGVARSHDQESAEGVD